MIEYKRLTKHSEAFGGFTLTELCESSAEMGCSEYCEIVQDSDCSTCAIQESFKRLAQYEDLGLSPSEFAELAKVKVEGRLIVLPCKTEDTVYITKCLDGTAGISEVKIHDIKILMENYFRNEIDWSFTPDDFGKSVFLTSEAAEDALKQIGGG